MRVASALTAVIIATALAAGIWSGVRYYQSAQTPQFQMTGKGVESLPEFALPDLEGKLRNSSEWKGDVLVINFWATWCPPCREEMPRFIEMQERYRDKGLQFIGIAIDDLEMVQDFHDVYGINFPTLIGGMEAVKLANTLGNRFDSLPFTAVFDRKGKTRYIQAGEITDEILETKVVPLL